MRTHDEDGSQGPVKAPQVADHGERASTIARESTVISEAKAISTSNVARLQRAAGNASVAFLLRGRHLRAAETDVSVEPQHAAIPSPDVGHDVGESAIAAAEGRDFVQRQAGPTDPLENDTDSNSPSSDGSGPTKKTRTVKFRRRRQRGGPFSGRLTGVFGGKRGKILKNWTWTWGRPRTKSGKSFATSKTVERKRANTAEIAQTGDTQITLHGAAFYKGEPIAGTIEIENFERSTYLDLIVPTPQLTPKQTCSLISSESTVVGTIQYRLGDALDTASGPKGRLIVEQQDKTTGVWSQVHDTGWLATNYAWVNETLPSTLVPNTNYRVRVFTEYWDIVSRPGYQWADGRTQVDYSLTIAGNASAQFLVETTKVGAPEILKKSKSLRLRL